MARKTRIYSVGLHEYKGLELLKSRQYLVSDKEESFNEFMNMHLVAYHNCEDDNFKVTRAPHSPIVSASVSGAVRDHIKRTGKIVNSFIFSNGDESEEHIIAIFTEEFIY